jgi:hypothetical protein
LDCAPVGCSVRLGSLWERSAWLLSVVVFTDGMGVGTSVGMGVGSSVRIIIDCAVVGVVEGNTLSSSVGCFVGSGASVVGTIVSES